MICITFGCFLVSLNGEMVGFFVATRGLRQRDPLSPHPLSPLIFTLVIEILSGILRKNTASPVFKYHWRCHRTKVSHLSFADDPLLFSRADTKSVRILIESWQHFAGLFGLRLNPSKSHIFFSDNSREISSSIQALTGFQVVTLPIRYLGVPLVSSRFLMEDCQRLVDVITARISHWTARFLSYAGRLQLINTILFSIQSYWSSLFILPPRVYKRIEQIFAKFFWFGPSMENEEPALCGLR